MRDGGIKVEVKDIIKDVQDGLLIVSLVEVLSGKTFPGKKLTAAKQKIQMVDNVNKALDFVKSVGVSHQTSAENIVDGNEKLILGFIFQIIIKFMKFDDEGENTSGDVKEALMLWLKNKTAGYNNVSIDNFTKSFHNGLAFCALIHRMRPKLLNYDSLNPSDAKGNLTLALDLGAKYCNIEKYLEVGDIPKLDEVSMIVYLSDWYYGVALLQKQDIASKRIGKLIILTELHDKMRADYTSAATSLSAWADKKIAELSVNKFDNTLEGVQRQIDEFYQYKENEKNSKLGELLDAQTLFDNLAVRLANNKRPAWKPANGLTPEALDAKFEQLDKAELEKSKALQAEKARQIEIINDGFCKAFADAIKEFTDWLNAKKTALKANKDEELEKQMEDLQKLTADKNKAEQFLAKIAAADEKIKERFITHNKFTVMTKGDCHALWTQFELMIEKKRELLKSQIEEKKKSGLTDEQLIEIRDNFNHFDRDKTQFLEKRELRACLQSLGEDASPKSVEAILQTYDKGAKGKISFEEFQQFM